MGGLVLFRRRRPLPPNWHAFVRNRGFVQVRMMVWSGLLVGLLLFQALRLWPAPESKPSVLATPTPAAPADPYAEARRSRAILDAQGAPAAVSDGGGDGGARITGTVRVIDGDTFDYAGMRVRIADIDTPEVNGRCPHESELAARATRRMRALLAAGPFELLPGVAGSP